LQIVNEGDKFKIYRRIIMKKLFMFIILLISLFFVFPIKSQAQGAEAGINAAVTNVTEYSFEDDLIKCDLVRPDGDLVGARRKAKVRSFIRVKENFIPEILKSVENL